MKDLKTKLWFKISVIAVILTMIAASGLTVYNGLNIKGAKLFEPYSYNISRDADYKVYLIDNSHYDTPYLSPKENPDISQYASSLIDYIDVNFIYNYSQSTLSNFYNTYSIKATITGQYEGTKSNSSGELWKKNYTILNETDVTNQNTSTYQINKNVKINYNSYNAEVESYRASTHLAIDAELKVVMEIKSYEMPFNSNDFNRNKPIKTDEIALVIPLNSSTTQINKKFESRSSGKIDSEGEQKTSPTLIIAGGACLAVSVILAIVLFVVLFKDDRTRYEKELDKIMRNYSDIIAEVEGNKVGERTFVDIKSFEDLVDIEEELQTPILHYEIKPGKESWFIIKSETTYRYILKSHKL